MLNNTTQIIANVPGKHLNPLLLAQSQWNDSLGFMMIAYTIQESVDVGSVSRFYDLFFLRGSHIYECARMNCDLRFQLHLDIALQTFKRSGNEESTRVYLFAASNEVLTRFHSTLFYEPCLKVQIEGLSKKQIQTLLLGTKCHKGIIECNEFTNTLPSLDLKDVASAEDLVQYSPPFKHGRILLYDVEKNKELIEARHASHIEQRTPNTKQDSPISESVRVRFPSESVDQSNDDLFSAAREREAEDFSVSLSRILNSPRNPKDRPPESDANRETGSYVIMRQESEHSPAPNAIPRPCPPIHGRDHQSPKKIVARRPRQSPSNLQHDEPPPELSDYVKLFDRTFRSFRKQVFDSLGDKCDPVIEETERKLRILTPEFDLKHLTENTAILVLDLIEDIAVGASFMKRSRLRQAALTLVADLYNKQYELLEKHQVIDKVEQFYYKLKK